MCIVCALCVLLFHCRFVTVFVSNSSGWLADGLANSGTLSMTQTRKLLQVVGSVGPGEKEGGGWQGGGLLLHTQHGLCTCCGIAAHAPAACILSEDALADMETGA